MLLTCFKSLTLVFFVMISANCDDNYMYLQSTKFKIDNQSLPSVVTPKSYQLKLHPNITEGYYDGIVLINVICLDPTHAIVLHAHQDLYINEEMITIRNIVDSTYLIITNVTRNESAETITVSTEEELKVGDLYELEFLFSGEMMTLNSDYGGEEQEVSGFFRGNYENTNKQKRSWFAGIKTQLTYARKVFPCFDEPAFKATFQISVARSADTSSLSVMPLESTEMNGDEDLIWDKFPPTPPLSTFSVGLVIFDLEDDESVNVPEVHEHFTVHYHHRHERYLNGMADSLPMIPHYLEYVRNYTETEYPLPSLNIVCLPKLPYGTTINSLGLILAPEYTVEDTYNFPYELPRQWMNHMITPQTWKDFEFSELFNTYFINSAKSKLKDNRLWIEGTDENIFDQLAVHHNYSDYENLNYYSSDRSERFLKMLNSGLTEEIMKLGLRNLMEKKMYNTFTENMLWDAMTQQGHAAGTLPESVTVENIATSWLHDNVYNYPVLHVVRDFEENVAYLNQRLFIRELPFNFTQEEEDLVWTIPISYLTSKNPDLNSVRTITWMTEKRVVTNNLPSEDSFVVVNPLGAGMFLVNYDHDYWKYLMNGAPQLPAITRMKLLNDALLLAATEELDYSVALNMSLMLYKETEYPIWTPFIREIGNIEPFYRSTALEEKINRYLRYLMTPTFESLTVPDYEENEYYPMFYYTFTDCFYKLGYQQYIDQEREKLEEIMPVVIIFNDNDTDLITFCPEFMYSSANWSENQEQLITEYMYSSANWSENQEQLITYLNTGVQYNNRRSIERMIAKCPGYTELVESVLNLTLDEDTVFTTELWNGLVNFATSTEISHNITFNFFIENFHELKKKFYFMKDMWSNLAYEVTQNIRTEDGLEKLTDFYNENKNRLGYLEPVVKSAIRDVRKVVEWNKVKLPEIEYWLDNVNYIDLTTLNLL